jgi:hypothetical protein
MKHNAKAVFFRKMLHAIGNSEETFNMAREMFMALKGYAASIDGMGIEHLESMLAFDFKTIVNFIMDYQKCPECGGNLDVQRVNDAPCTQTGDDSNYRVFCVSNKGFNPLVCDFEFFTKYMNPDITDDDEGPVVKRKTRKPKVKTRKCVGCK